MQDLDAWLAYIEQIHAKPIDMGLDRLRQVANRLELPKLGKWVVSVAGTNGKGSSCRFLEVLALQQGLKVGRYSSPHFERFNERVCLQAQPVSDSLLVQAFARVEQARAEISLSYFEFTTLAAFVVFAEQQLDVVILEVGLGGRLDAVNLVDADCAILVSVALDHQDFLGDDLNGIAAEKIGIARPAAPLFIGETKALEVLERAEQLTGSQVYRKGMDFGCRDGQFFWPQGSCPAFDSQLPQENLPAVLAAWASSPWALEVSQELQQALAVASLPGRMQTVRFQRASVLLDVAHNPHAAERLAGHLKNRPGPFAMVFSALADKDIAGIVRPFADLDCSWHLLPLAGPRGLTVAELAQQVQMPTMHLYDNLAPALQSACQPGAQVVVFGSFMTVSEAMAWLNQDKISRA